jgi:hypothetical protein
VAPGGGSEDCRLPFFRTHAWRCHGRSHSLWPLITLPTLSASHISPCARIRTTATTSLRFAFALTRSTRPISQTRSKMAGYGRRIAAQEARLIRCDRDGEHSLYCLQRARCPFMRLLWLARARAVCAIDPRAGSLDPSPCCLQRHHDRHSVCVLLGNDSGWSTNRLLVRPDPSPALIPLPVAR